MLDRLAWFILALIHLAPALALFRPTLITRLYGIEPSAAVFPLLHHRAALFAVVLVLCLRAAFDPAVRQLAVIAVGLSMLAFLAIYSGYGRPESLRMIAIADLAGLPFLAFLAWRAFVAG
ncbi:MAG: hypothetical protein ABR601_06795 [Parasphingopyxis sp.]|nr:hypothetical protein [Sphingomonadales bacterium]